MKNLMSKLIQLIGRKIVIGTLTIKVGTAVAAGAVMIAVAGGTAYGTASYFHIDPLIEAADQTIGEADAAADIIGISEKITDTGSDEPDETVPSKESPEQEREQQVDKILEETKEKVHYHSFSESMIEESSCAVQGLREFSCECGYSYLEQIPLKAHEPGEWTITSEATVSADGLRTLSCSVCGELMETEVLPVIPCSHNYRIADRAPASCLDGGYVRYECGTCGSSYTETSTAVGHDYVKDHVVAATCSTYGSVYEKCTRCGNLIESGTIEKTGHVYDPWEIVKEATCTENGLEKRKCSRCDAAEERQILAKGHDVSEWSVDLEATCTENGLETGVCSVCEETVEKVLAALGHDYVVIDHKDAGCNVDGADVYECSRCKDTYEQAITATGHKAGDWIIDLGATCETAGSRHTVCEVCKQTIETVEIPALGHVASDWIIDLEAGCETTGNKHTECEVCGKELSKEVIPASGHTEGKWEIVKDATCTEEGSKHILCEVCGKELDTAVIAEKAHEYGAYKVTKPATDEEAGEETATCKNCPATVKREIPKLPHLHDYNERVDAACVAVTCEADGKEVYACRCGAQKEEIIPATGHNYEVTAVVNPLCEMDGSETSVCQNEGCGDEQKKVLPRKGHTSGGWVIVKEATDLEEGLKEERCSDCHKLLNSEVIKKLNHVCAFVTEIERQAPTCTTDGFVIKQCRCKETEKTTLPKTNHANATWKVEREATYIETGLKQKVCDDCKAVIEEEVIPVVPHECDYELVEEKLPACTEVGLKTEKCTFCGKSNTVTLNATGHTESGMMVDTAPTCVNAGSQHRVCTVCGITMTTEELAPTGHTAGSWEVDANAGCETNGSKHVSCTVCGSELQREVISATGHSMSGWSVASEADCETDGSETNTCSNCGYSESRTIPAKGHSYGDWIVDVEPTEEEEGSRHKECANCGNQITEEIEVLPPHVHSYEETGRTDSTCTAAGSVTYTCPGCGDSYSEPIATKEHTPGDWVVEKAATEEENGREVRTCTECGTETDSRTTDKLPHTHNYTVDRKEATCTEDGYEKQTCGCGSVIEKTLPASGHAYGLPVVVDPTCTKEGTSTITCSTCGHSEVTQIAKIDHVYVETERVEPACEEDGSITYTCKGCDDTKVETTDAKGHDYSVTSEVAATCTADGYKVETCANCADTKKTATDTKLGHDYTKEVVTKEPELGVDGEKEIRCVNCGDVKETKKVDMLLTDGVDNVYTFKVADGSTEMVIGHVDDAMSMEMYNKINAYRVENGRNPLTHAAAGSNHDNYTICRSYEISYLFEHQRPWGAGTSSSLGENIVTGYNSFGTDPNEIVDAYLNAWKESPGHNNNMLNSRYTYTSVKMFCERFYIEFTGKYYYRFHCVQTFSY